MSRASKRPLEGKFRQNRAPSPLVPATRLRSGRASAGSSPPKRLARRRKAGTQERQKSTGYPLEFTPDLIGGGNERWRDPIRTGLGAGAVAHHADGIELGLLAGLFLGPFAHLVALVEQLDLLELLERFAEMRLRLVELGPKLGHRALEVLTPLHGGLGIGRIGEMRRVVNAGTILFGLDLALEVARDAIELGNHAFDLRDPAALFVDLKLLQANERFA